MEADSTVVDAVAPSPNFGERAGNHAPDLLLLHYTGMASGQAALDWLLNPLAQVSAHYFVWEDGRILQLVPEASRAWHAGVSAWQGDPDVNSRSIGIEIVNAGHPGGLPPYPDRQIAAVVALTRDILHRHRIQPEKVLAHSDVAPRRKCDPGEIFPWDVLHRHGIGHWVEPAPLEDGPAMTLGHTGSTVTALQNGLARYGYALTTSGLFDETTGAVVAAFQRHFRPARVDGVADRSTVLTLDRLLAALPR